MVIGPLYFRQRMGPATIIALACLTLMGFCVMADDQIVKTDGTIITGQIIGVSGDQVMVQGNRESVLVAFVPHGLEPESHPFGIAMLAAGANLAAAGYRVPSRLGPFDVGFPAHC